MGFVFATVLFLVGDLPSPTLTAGMLVVPCTHIPDISICWVIMTCPPIQAFVLDKVRVAMCNVLMLV